MGRRGEHTENAASELEALDSAGGAEQAGVPAAKTVINPIFTRIVSKIIPPFTKIRIRLCVFSITCPQNPADPTAQWSNILIIIYYRAC